MSVIVGYDYAAISQLIVKGEISMRKKLMPFVLGCVCTAIIMNSMTVFAETSKTISAIFGRVKLTVNGKAIAQETLLYDGTTYVPLRAAAEALGKDVGWDGQTNTASINDKGYVPPVSTPKPTPAPTPTPTPVPSNSSGYYQGAFSSVPKPDLSSDWDVKTTRPYEDMSGGEDRGFMMSVEYTNYDLLYNADKDFENYINKLKANGFTYYKRDAYGDSIYIKGDVSVTLNHAEEYASFGVDLYAGFMAAQND